MIIKMKIKDIVKDDNLLEKSGLNPYCVNEGADGEEFMEIEVEKVITK